VEAGDACGAGDAEVGEAFADRLGVDRLSVVAGEEPVAGSGLVGEVRGEFAERLDELDRVAADVEVGVVVGDGEVIDTNPGDTACGLRVEDHQQAGDPVCEGDFGVVEQACDQGPVLGGGHWCGGWSFDVGDAESPVAVPVADRPDEEVLRVLPGAGAGGEPVVEIGLGAAGEGGVAGVEPGEELDREAELLACTAGGPRSQHTGRDGLAEPATQSHRR